MEALLDNVEPLLRGLLTTVWMAALAAVGSLVLGIVITALRVSPIPVLRGVAFAYVQLFLNVPLLALLVLFVFALPDAGLLMPLPTTALVVLIIYEAAYVAEAVRSGINTVAMGQAEAARALGLDFRQSLTTVVLPQAFRTVVPPLGNVWIALAKNTSIAAGFAVTDLTALLQRLANSNADELALVFLAVVAGYLVITLPSAWAIGVLERRLAILR